MSLDFFAPEVPSAPPRLESMFFAVLLKPDLADQVLEQGKRVADQNKFTGNPMHRERLHFSLAPVWPVGRRWEVAVDAARRAGDRIRMDAFPVWLDGVATFGSRGGGQSLVFTTSSAEIHDLYARLRQGLAWERLRPGKPEFRPHVTAMRGHGFVAEAPAFGLGWQVEEFLLIRSFYGEGRYEILGRWPLRTQG